VAIWALVAFAGLAPIGGGRLTVIVAGLAAYPPLMQTFDKTQRFNVIVGLAALIAVLELLPEWLFK
jgi:hypothetical protein